MSHIWDLQAKFNWWQQRQISCLAGEKSASSNARIKLQTGKNSKNRNKQNNSVWLRGFKVGLWFDDQIYVQTLQSLISGLSSCVHVRLNFVISCLSPLFGFWWLLVPFVFSFCAAFCLCQVHMCESVIFGIICLWYLVYSYCYSTCFLSPRYFVYVLSVFFALWLTRKCFLVSFPCCLIFWLFFFFSFFCPVFVLFEFVPVSWVSIWIHILPATVL